MVLVAAVMTSADAARVMKAAAAFALEVEEEVSRGLLRMYDVL